jgi:DNA ligase-associated metallophosphoesterase
VSASEPHIQMPTGDAHGAARLNWAGEALLLLPERALLWPARRTLLIADPHFGKAAAFRAAGIPVPEATTQADLRRISALLARHEVRRLLILGDFFHARRGRATEPMAALAAWRRTWAELEVVLVRGNHDLGAGDPPREWNLAVYPQLEEPPFCFVHDGDATPVRAHRVGGHLHPTVRLGGASGGVTAPCFWFRPESAILPAFGSFTGGHRIRPRTGDRVFAIGPDQVLEIPVVARNAKPVRPG